MLSVWHWFVSLFLPSFKRDFRLKKRSNALRGGETRLSVRTVKAAELAFIEAKRRALTETAGGSGAGFSQEGQTDQNDSRPELMRAGALSEGPVIFGRNRESRTREAAGRRNWPEAVP